jgi:hypothetical protein
MASGSGQQKTISTAFTMQVEVTFGEDERSFHDLTTVEVTRVTQVWRSNLRCPVGALRGPLDADG